MKTKQISFLISQFGLLNVLRDKSLKEEGYQIKIKKVLVTQNVALHRAISLCERQ